MDGDPAARAAASASFVTYGCGAGISYNQHPLSHAMQLRHVRYGPKGNLHMHLFLQTNLGLKKSKRKKQYCANPTARRGLLMAGSAGRLTDRYRPCTGKALSLLMAAVAVSVCRGACTPPCQF